MVHLFEGVEVVLHAFDGDVAVGLDALSFQDFTERAFSLLA